MLWFFIENGIAGPDVVPITDGWQSGVIHKTPALPAVRRWEEDHCMMEMKIHEERCKGCGLCLEACPKGAITQSARLNKKSYLVMEVDMERCVRCTTCHTVCPDCVFEFVNREGGEA